MRDPTEEEIRDAVTAMLGAVPKIPGVHHGVLMATASTYIIVLKMRSVDKFGGFGVCQRELAQVVMGWADGKLAALAEANQGDES